MAGFELVVGYLATELLGKARRAGRLPDHDPDSALNFALEQLFNVVESRVGNNPALRKLQAQTSSRGEVPRRVRRQVEKALKSAADEDPDFRHSLFSALDQLRQAENRMDVSIKGAQFGDHNWQVNNF